ncbi:MAG: hypothetical protein A2017_03345, partial [Lentisphaerae bacterium GWF2_44_16]
MTIKSKLVSVGVAFTTVPLILFALIVYYQNTKIEEITYVEVKNQALSDLNHIVIGIYNMISSQQEILEKNVDANLNVAHDLLNLLGKVSFSDQKIQWEAKNQFNGDIVNITLPQFKIGSSCIEKNWGLNKETILVDHITKLLGGTCTIFQVMDKSGDMLRVATNIQDKNAKRTISTYIPAINPDGKPNPVISTVMKGKRYTGRAFVIDAWYIAAYEPLYDNNKNIIGMLYFGVKEESAASIRKQIMDILIGQTGYVFVIDSQGKYLISQNGKRDGEPIWEAKSSDGKYFIQEMISTAHKLKDRQTAEIRYLWKNPKDPKPRMKIVTFSYYAQWDWIIGAGSYENEVFSSLEKISTLSRKTNFIMLGISALFILVSVIFYIMFSTSISNSIKNVMNLASAMANGDMTQRLQIRSNDEIADMSKSLNKTCEQLSSVIGDIQKNSETLASSSEEVSAISAELASSSEQMTSQATTITGATEAMSANIKTVDEATNKMNQNVQTVSAASTQISQSMSTVAAAVEQSQANVASMASASEEMTSTIAEIARNTEKANETTNNAVKSVEQASKQVGELASASQEIEQ